jgi:hypothetical protein
MPSFFLQYLLNLNRNFCYHRNIEMWTIGPHYFSSYRTVRILIIAPNVENNLAVRYQIHSNNYRSIRYRLKSYRLASSAILFHLTYNCRLFIG